MASNLLIVESPSKAKTLKKYLGKDYEILASYGHVRDLVPKAGAVDPDDNFRMKYELIERNARHVEAIAKAVKGVDSVLLATDPDREGEAIAWHLAEILKSRKALKAKKLKRAAIGNAAPEAEIRRFLDTHAKGAARVREVEKKRKLRSPAAPFTTSTLQQEAVRKLGFSTDRAMKVAQSLYEGVAVGKAVTGLITYMRTDSVTLSKEAIAEMRGYITKNYGSD